MPEQGRLERFRPAVIVPCSLEGCVKDEEVHSTHLHDLSFG